MTKEEAITILKDISWQMGSVKRWENIEAIDMAIEALQQEEHLVELEAKAVAIIKSERHGEWVEERLTSTKGGTYSVARCSECGCAITALSYNSYCPNCGAKMDR